MDKQDDTPKHQIRKANTVISWLIMAVVLTLCSLYLAIYPLSLPNASLVLYGFALLCMWQILGMLQWQLAIVDMASQERTIWKIVLSVVLMVFSYTSVLSGYSTFVLFPHPTIHEFEIDG